MVATEPRRITDLETYLCRSLGLALLALALLSSLLTGALPLSTTASEDLDVDDDTVTTSKDPYSYPTLIITTTYHAITSFYLYTQLTYNTNFAFSCGLAGSFTLFCLGLWVVLFGSEKGRISKRTGADKRTSNFPFSNRESAKYQKKEEKKEEKEKKRRSVGARTRSGT